MGLRHTIPPPHFYGSLGREFEVPIDSQWFAIKASELMMTPEQLVCANTIARWYGAVRD
jgi:hypothetical protein